MDVDVSPDMQFYNLLESYPYSPTGALCEYIDNALDAFNSCSAKKKRALGGKLMIKIEFSPSEITVRDFGVGITLQDIQRAVKPAYTSGKMSLSEFGIGMKAASVWFGRRWQLTSSPHDSNQQFDFIFDLDDLIEAQAEKVEINVSDNESIESGLEIRLSKLKREIDRRVAELVWEDIQEIYQRFTSGKKPILEIEFSYEKSKLPLKSFEDEGIKPLKYPLCKFKQGKGLYVIGKPITWKKDIEFTFNGKPVTGFISVRTKSSQANNPGIRLFRYGRLIQGTERRPYRPVDMVGPANKHAPSRVYGELDLDGQPISNSKGGFVFDEELFLKMLMAQDGVMEYVTQAENYRVKLVEAGDVINCRDTQEYEKISGSKSSNTNKDGKNTRTTKKQRITKKSSANTYIQFIENLYAPEDLLLLENFIDECIRLYQEGRWWPFCLCYRVLLEVSIINKLKNTSSADYDKAKDKSVVGLFNYLHGNSSLIPAKYKSFKKTLKSHALEENPYINLLNLSSHGHYSVVKHEVDSLLANTQQAIEWAFSDDD